ncbi:MAG: transaldolase [Deltaproteobacteria bacterium]|nr:transaldolase [Deltaproteobacteria bacterium]
MTRLQELAKLGQSIWLDYISRSLITSGELQSLIGKGLRGITSNPTIFEKAISGSSDYDDDIRRLSAQGKSDVEIYEALAIDDITRAADLLRPLHEETRGVDGYVSLEADPKLAYDTEGTIVEVRRLWKLLARPNVMIKVPATAAGIPAIERLTTEGINVNITLIFSLSHYDAVARAYIGGLEKLAAAGGPVEKVASVASFFVSRIDTMVDKALEAKRTLDLQGRIAVDYSKSVYSRFREILATSGWKRLAERDARVQRLLWGSTGTKNPGYSDVLYVDHLIGPDTVNTLPPTTLEAFRDHGRVAVTLTEGLDAARARLSRLEALGISIGQITQKLQDDGVMTFARSLEGLLNSISEKRKKL